MSGGMAIRLAGAVLAALLGLIWWQIRSPLPETQTLPSEASSNRLVTVLRKTTLFLSVFWAAVWLLIALLRLRYPFELEWIGGAMRDHCERVLAGKPLYVPPGPDWFPYEYPPLYFWMSALLMRCTGGVSFAAMRLVSILSTLGSALLLFRWAGDCICRQARGKSSAEGRDVIWGAIAAGVFLATYRFTGAWYDAERLDMLFLFLSLLGVLWLQKAVFLAHAPQYAPPNPQVWGNDLFQSKTSPPDLGAGGRTFPQIWGLGGVSSLYAGLSALAFGLAFLTKQQAILFLFGGLMALAWRRDGRLLSVFALAGLLCFAGPVWALNRATEGWFGYYCFKVPLANGIQIHLARQYLVGDLPLYAPFLVLILTGFLTAWKRSTSPSPDAAAERSVPHGRDQAVLICMTMMGMLGSLLSRAHWGGDQNVLIAGFTFLSAAGSVAAGVQELKSSARCAPLYGLVLAQFLVLVYRPDLQLPKAVNLEAGQTYAVRIRQLEKEGEVLCLDHGSLTSQRHFQIMGLLDVIGTEKGLPPSLSSALHAHRYAAIVMDAHPEAEGIWTEFLRDYAPAECWNITQPWVVTGYPTPNTERKVWVLRPR